MEKEKFSVMLQQIHEALLPFARDEFKNNLNTFMKNSAGRHLGVSLTHARKISNQFYKDIKKWPKEDIRDLIDFILAQSTAYELKVICFQWWHKIEKQWTKEDIKAITHWAENHIIDWCDCDDLCMQVIGPYFVQFPEFISLTDKWSQSENMWHRRIAYVSLIYGLRRGLFDKQCFKLTKDFQNEHDPDLTQKGFGWMLKEATHHFEDKVVDYIRANQATLPRLVIRYALENSDQSIRSQFIGKRKS